MITVFGSLTGKEEINELSSSIESCWMGMGEKVKQFEKEFSSHINADFLMVDSGSNALLMAVKMLDLPPGSDIILPSFTWVACAQAIILNGHRPVFADVEIDTQNISARTIEKAMTPNTKAIMVVHYAGKPVEMEPILDFSLPVIEDAAHAVDSSLNGKKCGTIGDVGIYSFDSVKNLATPEGGGLTCRSGIEKAKYLRYCGIGKSGLQNISSKDRWWEYDIKDIFPKTLPNDISAAVGLVQLQKLKKHQQLRKKIWDIYQQELNIDWIQNPVNAATNEVHSYFSYFIRVLNGKRDQLAKYLLDNKIYTTLRYHPLHLNNIYKSDSVLPNCEKLNEEGLNIPLHPNLTEQDQNKVIEKIKEFGKKILNVSAFSLTTALQALL